ncbi:MAG TPA: hypothetical protein VIJ27_03830 [Mucilaginibacter sp.]
MARDNFSVNTTRIMAERVGYLCSNPNCRNHTVGPNSQLEKSTKIGEAAHITAAAVGGPRYNGSLSLEQRSHIENGIWLCSNCADLIDKDFEKYPITLLNKWKSAAEHEAYERITGNAQKSKSAYTPVPYLEADLKYYGSGRRNLYYSDKNPIEQEENGNWVMPIKFDGTTIIVWALDWDYSLDIYNNSSQPAFNLKIEQASNTKFSQLQSLDKINSLKPFEKIELEASYKIGRFEGTHVEADDKLFQRLPADLDGLMLELSYQDEARNEHRTTVLIEGQEIVNIKH